MKGRFAHITVMTLLAICFAFGAAVAQDAGMQGVELNDADKDKFDREKMTYSPGESDNRYKRSATYSPKDSLTTTTATTPATTSAPGSKSKTEKPASPAAKPVDKQQAKPQDDSILSFNFLYYIIEKYKLQDIVD